VGLDTLEAREGAGDSFGSRSGGATTELTHRTPPELSMGKRQPSGTLTA
jgi:hypothetical protein